MALQIWLPFVKDLNNQGLSNITISGGWSGKGSIVDNGKLGKCLKTVNVASQTDYIPDFNNNSYSMGGWFKFNKAEIQEVISTLTVTSTASTATGCLLGNASYNGLGITWNSNNLYSSEKVLNYLIVFGSIRTTSAGLITTSTFEVPFDTWTHIFLVWDLKNSQLKFYKNGILFNTKNINNFSDGILRNFFINYNGIYGGNGPGAAIPFKANDIRLYDHALSAKEIELLARGLVMHYPLNDNSIQVMNNCFNYPTFNTSSSSGGWSHWGASGASGSYGQTTDRNYIYRKDQTYAHWFANASTGTNYYILYQEPAFDGGFRSLCCILKEENGKEINESICWPSWNDNASGGATFNKWTSVSPLGDGFYLCKCEGLKQNGSNDLVALDINPGTKIYVSECYLENDRTVCSDIFYSSDIIYDSSGYNYHGIKSGSLLCVNDTPRNSIATYFPSGTGSFSHPNITFSQYTISFWGKHTAIGKMLMGSNASISSLNTTWYWYGDKSFKYPLGEYYYSHNAGSEESLLNKWTHFVAIYDGSNITIYRNGINEGSKAVTGNMTLDYLSIGNGYSSSSYWENGFISDFRIYATALSEKAIQELYQMGASATKNGNLLTYEFKEY